MRQNRGLTALSPVQHLKVNLYISYMSKTLCASSAVLPVCVSGIKRMHIVRHAAAVIPYCSLYVYIVLLVLCR